MKLISFLFLLSIFALPALAQQPAEQKRVYTINSDCGDSPKASPDTRYYFGTVTSVTNDNRLNVTVTHAGSKWAFPSYGAEENAELPASKMFTVALVGIDPAENKAAITTFLRNKVLGEKVTVTGAAPNEKNELRALVQLNLGEEFIEINKHLLVGGIASFNNFTEGGLVPVDAPCELGKAEAYARHHGLGIWAAKKQKQ